LLPRRLDPRVPTPALATRPRARAVRPGCGKSIEQGRKQIAAGSRNSGRPGLIIGLLIGALGLARIAVPSLWDLDMMQYGFDLSFIGGFFAIMAGVTVALPRPF
jgi:hypothetical protein